MKLSILIPGVPTRFTQGSKLYISLFEQAKKLANPKDVEILWFVDNWTRSLGEKRNALLAASRGQYVAFCDDDDQVAENYLEKIILAIDCGEPDVVTFRQKSIWNGMPGIIEFKIEHDFELMKIGEMMVTKRKPWHVCAWKRALVHDIKFPDVNWGEDAPWADIANLRAESEVHIPEFMHFYEHKDETSEAWLALNGQR